MKVSEVERWLKAQIKPEREWTEVSLFLLYDDNPRSRDSIAAGIRRLLLDYPGLVDLVATSQAMATFGERHTRAWYLRRYYRHTDGRLISHLHLHRDILAPREDD